MMSRRHWRGFLMGAAVATAVAIGAAGCGSSEDAASSPTPQPSATVTTSVIPSPVPGTALDAAKAGDLNAFLAAVAAAGLQKELSSKGPFTLFAPNEEAFKSVSVSDLRQNIKQLKDVLEYHIVPGENIQLADVTDGQTFVTAEGAPLTITLDGGTTLVNDATVVSAYTGGDWTIYVIDQVLFPPSASPSS
jgi:uncharacterized surface protein with fasciclin (FAS1) repeats